VIGPSGIDCGMSRTAAVGSAETIRFGVTFGVGAGGFLISIRSSLDVGGCTIVAESKPLGRRIDSSPNARSAERKSLVRGSIVFDSAS